MVSSTWELQCTMGGFFNNTLAPGTYTPPECEWTNVLFNLTMTSTGRQFDRLAMMFVGDTEVFRTSTAEPTWYGIEFKYASGPGLAREGTVC